MLHLKRPKREDGVRHIFEHFRRLPGPLPNGEIAAHFVLLRSLAELSLTVDDPAISEWLQDENVIIHRRGFKRTLDNPTLYIQQGQRIDGVGRWHSRLSLQGGEPGPRVARVLATNRGTCERLMIEGVLPR